MIVIEYADIKVNAYVGRETNGEGCYSPLACLKSTKFALLSNHKNTKGLDHIKSPVILFQYILLSHFL